MMTFTRMDRDLVLAHDFGAVMLGAATGKLIAVPPGVIVEPPEGIELYRLEISWRPECGGYVLDEEWEELTEDNESER